MWYKAGKAILTYRVFSLLIVLLGTGFMAWKATKVQLSYDFTRALPTDNPKYREYQDFLKRFGGDGNTMVIGVQTSEFYQYAYFNRISVLADAIRQIPGVTDVLSIPTVLNLVKDTADKKLVPEKIFHPPYTAQQQLDSAKQVFENLPFYRGLLYNAGTHSYLMGVSVNKDTINSRSRTRLVNDILAQVQAFERKTGAHLYCSGLPYIRTTIGNRVKNEMQWFLIGSLVLLVITLQVFFRSFSATLMSLLVVSMGVVWSLGTLVLLGYKITLLTALIPPLIVVIGIPNCIYFLNKYHTAFREYPDREKALITMVGRMGIVTLFCNIAAAIGFTVFAFTHSDLLKEFGAVAGINIMVLFFLSLFFIPPVLSYLPHPKEKHTRYLDNKFLEKILLRIEKWAFHHARAIYGVTIVLAALAIAGIFRIKSEGFIVDDLPRNDQVYTDLKWFEQQFGGVMPLEIVVDTHRKKGIFRASPIQKIDALSAYIAKNHDAARPLSFVEGLKFAKQAYFDGDSLSYTIPYESDLVFMAPYLAAKNTGDSGSKTGKGMAQLISSFMDSTEERARISVNMKDVGSVRLPVILHDFDQKAKQLFDTAAYTVTFTGSSVSFLEGSSFIIRGLKESIVWAFVLIAFCMLYLFRSFRILVCSL
ncbi:MAG TPA: MMPL family transporter, partial [Sediminibacterium sp.]|nr:MMPL family transporter [Sediminibacterium sp.]